MENIQWIFSGIGTDIFTLLIGALIGGIAGYKIGIKKSYTQSQVANNGSKQKQELYDRDINNNSVSRKNITNINQFQKSGENSEQSQVGRFKNGNW